MRDIKFRIWDNEEKTMIENKDTYSLDFRGNVYFSSVMVDDYILGDEGYILMQYTGLKDKNGKEIYEGDILLCCELEINGTVFFNEGCFRAQWENCIEDLYENCDVYEVIGNIYENPELLK
ncbi:DNA-packaging protein [Paraclostridium sordellii 8483]|uniref:YopX family protein n=1 Tax=Paraclostridium sordellii TaxID=1505 RepID=UPI00031B2F1B|nr:YopX family protein [Paeniclostridium sordellii]TAN69171.1 DNA-packaging protein [Paeniclostridium sordellii 8483]